MLHEYGKAVIEERTNPHHLEELARYFRQEYGLGTEPWFVIADGAHRTTPSPRRGNGALRVLLKGLLSLVRGDKQAVGPRCLELPRETSGR